MSEIVNRNIFFTRLDWAKAFFLMKTQSPHSVDINLCKMLGPTTSGG